jgi:hypothetical protein
MKQFIVDRHTTPNTPTLEQVPTEKLPIYENRAAVEADLANLTDGQIVATADTGDELAQPVDVVEEGNMHAVSSNAVADAIGGKKLKFIYDTYTITDGYIRLDPQMTTENYKVIAQNIYKSGAPRDFNLITQVVDKNNLYVYVTKFDGTSFNNVQINLLLMIVY